MLAERSLPPEAWCGVIGALELGLNTAVAESTGKPPSLGAFGELPRLPVDVFVGAWAPVGVVLRESRVWSRRAKGFKSGWA